MAIANVACHSKACESNKDIWRAGMMVQVNLCSTEISNLLLDQATMPRAQDAAVTYVIDVCSNFRRIVVL